MINTIAEAVNEKTKDQYKIIESKYEILKRYLRLHFEKQSSLLTESEIEVILQALDGEPLENNESVKETEGDE